jgi:hypothetical protein
VRRWTAAFFLERDNYVTGQAIAIDGGLTLRRERCVAAPLEPGKGKCQNTPAC